MKTKYRFSIPSVPCIIDINAVLMKLCQKIIGGPDSFEMLCSSLGIYRPVPVPGL